MSLDKLVIEGLSEARLRRLLRAIGVPADPIRDFRTLKLLDAVVRMAQSAEATGLELSTDGTAVWDRLATEGTQPAQPIAHLFALHDTRILKAHNASDRTTRVQTELERFGVTPGEEAPGYGLILDHIYDALADEVASASAKIAAAT